MTAWVLVRAVEAWNPDDLMVFGTGFPVEVRNRDVLGSKEIPPKFVRFIITDADKPDIDAYCEYWQHEIDWEFVGHDYSIDGHRINAFVKPELVSASGLNSLTRAKIENFLTRWGAVVQSIGPNSVVFDVTVYNAIVSEGFWGRDMIGVGFSELSYNESTGVHRIQVNYSGVPVLVNLDDAEINRFIQERGGTIVQHVANTRVRFDINRSSVFDWFKLDVYQKTESTYSVRKWYFTQQAVNLALANGGDLELTRQQALAYLHHRLLD